MSSLGVASVSRLRRGGLTAWRWLCRTLRPPRLGPSDFEASPHLRRTPDDYWLPSDDDPHFVARGGLPAGWLRVHWHIETASGGRTELTIDLGNGRLHSDKAARMEPLREPYHEVFLRLDRSVAGIRFDPLDRCGPFRLRGPFVESLTLPRAVLHAIRRKWQMLRAYRNTLPVLVRGLGLLALGRWREAAQKTMLGLSDSRYFGANLQSDDRLYQTWRQRRALTDADRQRLRAEAAALVQPPRFSVLMPVYETPEAFLRSAIESVLRQTYPHWELCIADDGSQAPHVRAVLDEYAARDSRVRRVHVDHGGISMASNAALTLATGDYVALLDHDDELAEHALSRMAAEIVANPTLDMLYSDEDLLEPNGWHHNPYFKPDWSPDHFLSCMYTCHLGIYRTSLVREIGGFRSAFDGAQDYDLVLRLIARTDRIRHVPDVLYHWRTTPTSTAGGAAAKPYAIAAGRRALEAHLTATQTPGHVEDGALDCYYRVRFALRSRPLVSIIIPSLCRPVTLRGQTTYFLDNLVASIRDRSSYSNVELLTLDRGTMPEALARRLADRGVRRLTYDAPFNWSAVNNQAARSAQGDYLLFLNDDTEVLTPDWIEAMLEYAQQPAIGAVGPKLLFPDGRIQHAGVTILDGRPGHPFYGYPQSATGYRGSALIAVNYSAVTGACLLTRTALFHELGGFNESMYLNYSDVDYCLRLRERGYRIVFTPYAQLIHHESVTKNGIQPGELEHFLATWAARFPRDPYYNPNLTTRTGDYRIDPSAEPC